MSQKPAGCYSILCC